MLQNDLLHATEASDSLNEIRRFIEGILESGEPVPDRVVVAAVDDPLLLHHLLVCKGHPELLQLLMCRALPHDSASRNALSLTAEATRAFWTWAKSGFTFVDEDTYRRRMSACRTCPHFVDPPGSLIYQITRTATAADDGRICNLCGCYVARKARLPGESCPEPSNQHPGLNRWGEQLNSA